MVARLNRERDTQCRNFQSDRLATLRPGNGTMAERAIEALADFSCVGLVENFEQSLQRIAALVREHFPSFEYEIAHSNKSKLFDFELSPALEQLLKECNQSDLMLWQKATERFNPQASSLA